MWQRVGVLVALIIICVCNVRGKIESEEEPDTGESEDRNDDLEENSTEHIGAGITQIVHHPYAASLLKNGSYICSAVILNTYWLMTESKCFDPDIISSYISHRNLKNFTIRVGSSYNNKGGSTYQVKMLKNNFDLKVTAVKLSAPMEFNSRVRAIRLPSFDEEVTLGYLASVVAWTPNGHMRLVNAPLIEASICASYTKLLPGHYICVGAVQDPNRHFCRKDNGGAVIQNNTVIGVASFLHECAVYSRTHAFPKVSSFARWLDSVIWDEDNRPTTLVSTSTTVKTTQSNSSTTKTTVDNQSPFYEDPRQFMLTLPFAPINVPLEPGQDNSVIPRMSLYESYLQNFARAKTSTTHDPSVTEESQKEKIAWMKKYGNAIMMVPPQPYSGKGYENYEYR